MYLVFTLLDSSKLASRGFASQALEAAEDKQRPSVKMLRACAYYRLGKFSRALSECSEVLGSGYAKLACFADQLKGYGSRAQYATYKLTPLRVLLTISDRGVGSAFCTRMNGMQHWRHSTALSAGRMPLTLKQ